MTEARLAGCAGCIGSDRPGYVVVWDVDGEQMLWEWKRCPEKCTAESRAATIERLRRRRAEEEAEAARRSQAAAAPAAAAHPDPVPEPACPKPAQEQPVRHPASPRPTSAYRGRAEAGGARSGGRSAPARSGRSAPPAVNPPRRWPAVALDHGAEGWELDVAQVPRPAGTKLTDWFAWLGTGLPLRIDRVHDAGRTGDGMVCLSATALKALGLPASFPTTEKALAALTKKLTTAAASVGMELSQEIGPIFHAFRRVGAAGGPKSSLRVVITPWIGQGSEKQQVTSALIAQLATTPTGELDALTLARRIRTYVADLGIAPGITPATTSKLLLDSVRPRSEPFQDDGGEWRSRLRDGALPGGDTVVPPAAGARHPLTRDLQERGEALCEEEDFKWWARPLTEAEAAMPYAVACDVCASYLSVTMSLRLPVGPLEHHTDPVWDTKSAPAGLWWCDFTNVEVDPLLPHPATFHGEAPAGPGWYATPTVAYMVTEYGFDPATITEAYLSTLTVPFLKEWTVRLREAYKRVYALLGLKDGQEPEEFLAAYAVHKDLDAQDLERTDALVLAGLYKAIYKGGIGKWTDGAQHLDDEVWLQEIVANWSYRPEVRFHIISAARIANHRRMRKTYKKTGRAPFAINVDSYLYATEQPSPLELLTPPENGKPVLGVLRLGIGPGQFKHESSIPMDAIVELMSSDDHPSRLTHAYDTDGAAIAAAEQKQEAASA
ncbi:hypothetical protein OG883_44705 [Streptomyces sp. NBC_01142]|uniref:hypothetical protein n=1 Tax=Streptomyces sp. NBC_01142 TaxID=2975865 RepID=UPI00225B7DF4|nr:hypothetical protein [Streptomyces sp. NBC_01142]MCX4826747.1 hypothetical protein [Streptomyces sp. NBC_01142]